MGLTVALLMLGLRPGYAHTLAQTQARAVLARLGSLQTQTQAQAQARAPSDSDSTQTRLGELRSDYQCRRGAISSVPG